MAPDADPYRILGLSRDATLEEVRRAYRRLAKANHPDAAGEAALPRFLAIQAAYDTIAGPDARARRPGAARPSGPRRAWDAERDRTDATYRAYGGRSRRARPGGAAAPGPRPTGPRPPADRPPGTSRPPRPERPPNKATLGSTSYDGAEAEPFEPDWGGASWYGTTSGTYWTLNPKEYADPRKHGPEYQARARRRLSEREAADARDAAGAPEPVDSSTTEAAPEPGATAAEPAERPTGRPAGPPPSHTTSSWWEATAGHAPRSTASGRGRSQPDERSSGAWAGAAAAGSGAPPGEARPTRPAGTSPAASSAPRGSAPDLSTDLVIDAIRAWLDDAHPGTVGRVGRAVVGWAPIALGIGWMSGEMSGCGRFAAGCDDATVMFAWVVQIAVLLTLLVVGRLARIASAATLATLAAAVPAALLLTATGSPDDAAAGRIALSGLLVIAWVVGLVFGTIREIRGRSRGAAPPEVPGPAGPVS